MIAPSIATFLITIVNIGILFFVLRALLFKRVTEFMDARTKKISDAIAGVERDKNQARLLLTQYEEQLKKAGEDADAVVKAARESAQKEAGRIIAEGKKAAEALIENARKQLEAERQAALALFKAEAAALVVSAAGRLVQRELTGEDNKRHAALLLKELGKN
jgi:F-type H+-transporting ATPase subunit b